VGIGQGSGQGFEYAFFAATRDGMKAPAPSIATASYASAARAGTGASC